MERQPALDTAVLIPSYKPDQRLPAYIEDLRREGVGKIIIADDGSGEDFRPVFDSIPQDGVAHVIHYLPNGGKGVALKRCMTYIQEECPDVRLIVTADGDGQHTAKDVMRMFEALRRDDSGLLLGARDFRQAQVPPKSRMGNRITATVFYMLYGQWVEDTQTGLRGFTRELMERMAAVRGERYEFEMNVLIDCATNKIPIRPLPIETVYENNNEGSHFRAVRDSARIYRIIFGGFLRFASISITCFLADYGLYLLLNNLLKPVAALRGRFRFLMISMVPRILVATVAARVVSGLLNFFLNRKFVFDSRKRIRKTFPRYLCLFLLIMALSAALTSTLHLWTGWSDNTAKIPVDILLFFFNYQLQQKWVFSKKRAPEAMGDGAEAEEQNPG